MKPFCTAPFVGIVIDPNFDIRMCCSDGTHHLGSNLREIDSLHDFFYNGQKYLNLRKDFQTYSLLEYAACIDCHRSVEGFASEIDNYNTNFKNAKPVKLKYLELTTSNVCNQTCVMCLPRFSSSHVKLHKEGNIMTMSDNDLRKVFEVLPDLEVLMIKGGEPFADQKNAKLLEETYRVNPNIPKIVIVSNGTSVSTRFKNILAKFKNVQLLFSIDGVNKVYEWQRGAPYTKTVKSINTFYKDTGINYGIISAITIYNLPSIVESVNQYYNDFNGLISIDTTNVVVAPLYMSPALYDVDVLFKMLNNVKTYTQKNKNGVQYYTDALFSINSYSTEDFAKHQKDFIKYTNFYNKVRGFNILDYVPELKDIYNNTI